MGLIVIGQRVQDGRELWSKLGYRKKAFRKLSAGFKKAPGLVGPAPLPRRPLEWSPWVEVDQALAIS